MLCYWPYWSTHLTLSLHFGTGFKDELESIKTVYEKLFVVSGDSGKLIWKAEKGDVVVKCSHLPSFSPHLTSPHMDTITCVILIWCQAELPFSSSPGIKPFQCDRCGKKFTRAYSLKMHRLKHEGKRCFRCQICSATFTSFGEYKHHMRVSRHIIRKPRIYECKTCGAMFTNSGNLIVHLRSLNHEASELANYFQSRWGVRGHWPHHLLRSHLDQKITSV